MLKNYFKIDENKTVSMFLKEFNEKKHIQYLILDSKSPSFVDIRTISLKIGSLDEKVKNLKKPISICENEDYLDFLIDSGERVILSNGRYYDYIDGLKRILELNPEFLNLKLEENIKKEFVILSNIDKISVAKSLLLKKRVNLLPILEKGKIIGEIRPMDFLISNLYFEPERRIISKEFQKSNDELLVSNLMNKKPIQIDKTKTYRDALKLLIYKNLPSVIVSEDNRFYSIISYKDIFRKLKNNNIKKSYTIDFVGIYDLYEDETDLVVDYTEKAMTKISKISDYNNLKLTIKRHGNNEGTHKKKFSCNLLLSKGNKVIHIDKEMIDGTCDEFHNDKVQGKWNVPLLILEALTNLKKKVIDEKRKSRKNIQSSK